MTNRDCTIQSDLAALCTQDEDKQSKRKQEDMLNTIIRNQTQIT